MNISIVHVIVGSLILVYGLICLKKMIVYYRKGKVLKGIIKDVEFVAGAKYPTVEYYDKDILEKSVTIRFNTTGPISNYKIGSTVELLCYKHKNKTKLIIKSWFNNFYNIIIEILVGFFCAVYGFVQ